MTERKHDLLGWVSRNFVAPIVGGIVTGLIVAYASWIRAVLLSIEALQVLGLIVGFAGSVLTIWWLNHSVPRLGPSTMPYRIDEAALPRFIALGIGALFTFMGGFFLFPAMTSSMNTSQLTPAQLQSETLVSASAIVMMTTMFAWILGLLAYLLYERYA